MPGGSGTGLDCRQAQNCSTWNNLGGAGDGWGAKLFHVEHSWIGIGRAIVAYGMTVWGLGKNGSGWFRSKMFHEGHFGLGQEVGGGEIVPRGTFLNWISFVDNSIGEHDGGSRFEGRGKARGDRREFARFLWVGCL